MADGQPVDRRIQAYTAMRELMGGYYLRAKNAQHNGEALGWVTSGAPVEVLLAMDVIPIYPENHAAMCGIQKMAVSLMEEAEKLGYSRDLCSYARTDFGQMTTGISPIMGLPKPDFVFAANNICSTVVKWYEVVARYYNVPMFLLDLPFLHRGEEPDAATYAYVRAQMRGFVRFLEDLYKKKFDWDRFQEVLLLSARGSRLWGEVLHTAKNVPAPMSCFDGFVHIGPIVTLRGTQEAIDYYTLLLAELKDRIARGVGAIATEKFRLVWDNLPIWFIMKPFSEALAARETCLVAATYTSSWEARFEVEGLSDWDAILNELATAYLTPYINSNFDRRVRMLIEMAETYRADGILLHSDRSCKPYSVGQYQIRDRVQKEAGIPGLVIEADQCDSRVYADGPTMNRVDAFLESLPVRH